MAFAPGQNVGPYRIIEQLGQGGMATVFKAYHPALDRYVAIKVLHPAFKEDASFLTRFQREARIVAKLDHPNIIPIHDSAQEGDTPYLVIRYVEGKTLKAFQREGLLPLEQLLGIVRPVMSALAYAHAQGVLHRDIKPSNIMISNDGHVYLTDFGLARMAQAGESTLSQDMLIGTPQYISPEQAKGEPVDPRSDIYSLGVVLFEMLTGRVPFSADTPYSIIHDHIYAPLPLPRSINPALAPEVERVLLKALAKEPAARFNDASEFLTSFENALGLPALATTPPPVPVPAQVASASSPRATPAPVPVAVPVATPTPAPTPAAQPQKRGISAMGCAIVAIVLLILVVVGGGLLVLARPDLQRVIANQAQNQGALNENVRVERTRVAQNLTDAVAHLRLADALARTRDSEAAFAEYDAALRINNRLLNAYLHAGELAEKLGQFDRAKTYYTKGIEANPENVELRLQLGDVFLTLKQYEDARANYEKALSINPRSAIAHARLGDYYRAVGKSGDAVNSYMRATELEPNLPEAHLGLGLIAVQQNATDKARREFQAVVSNPNASQDLRARAEEQLKKLDGKK